MCYATRCWKAIVGKGFGIRSLETHNAVMQVVVWGQEISEVVEWQKDPSWMDIEGEVLLTSFSSAMKRIVVRFSASQRKFCIAEMDKNQIGLVTAVLLFHGFLPDHREEIIVFQNHVHSSDEVAERGQARTPGRCIWQDVASNFRKLIFGEAKIVLDLKRPGIVEIRLHLIDELWCFGWSSQRYRRFLR